MLRILTNGLSSTIQDTKPRLGHFEKGFSTGGAIDMLSAHLANLLVGNPGDFALIEATYTLPEFEVSTDCLMAVTGGVSVVFVNDGEAGAWETVRLKAGDKVTFGATRRAPRAYIAFSGGIDVPEVLGSRSTNIGATLGGHKGRTLQAGDELSLGPSSITRSKVLRVPESLRIESRKNGVVRVIPALHVDRMTEESRKNFFEGEWKVTPLGDRFGIRFSGPKTEWTITENVFGAGSDPSNIVDAGYPLGAIEIPGGNEPILLHRDAPTMGGFAMVAVTVRADLDVVGQYMPGETVRFCAVTRNEALGLWKEYLEVFEGAASSLENVTSTSAHA